MGVETNNLNPKLNYVPWININDIHTSEDQNDAENKNLVELICRKYSVCFFLVAFIYFIFFCILKIKTFFFRDLKNLKLVIKLQTQNSTIIL